MSDSLAQSVVPGRIVRSHVVNSLNNISLSFSFALACRVSVNVLCRLCRYKNTNNVTVVVHIYRCHFHRSGIVETIAGARAKHLPEVSQIQNIVFICWSADCVREPKNGISLNRQRERLLFNSLSV